MAESSECVPSSTSLPNEDFNMDDSSLETLITGAWDRAVFHHLSSLCDQNAPLHCQDVVLRNLKESQSELLSQVQKLKEEWQVDGDLQMKSYDQEIEGLTHAHNLEVERLRMELHNRANTLKDELITLQQSWQLEVAALTSPVMNIPSAVPNKR